jgi:hypothetical protein
MQVNTGEKRKRSDDEENGEHVEKRRKVVDSGTQTTPKKESSSLDIDVEDTPLTKKWTEKIREAEAELKKAKEFVEIRRRSRNLLNELKM